MSPSVLASGAVFWNFGLSLRYDLLALDLDLNDAREPIYLTTLMGER